MRPFKPEHYYRAALERMRQAQFLYRQGDSYALAMYVAGVAAEAMLRAFKGLGDKSFDEKHDLQKLLKGSRLLNITAEELSKTDLSSGDIHRYQREIQEAINGIDLLWSNDYRYASEDRLRSYLRKMDVFWKSLKGDILKGLAYRLLNFTQNLINRGNEVWTLFQKN